MKGIIKGVAYSVAWIIRQHDEETMALELLKESGYTYADLLKDRCDPYDLETIAAALGLRIDGKPQKDL